MSQRIMVAEDQEDDRQICAIAAAPP